MEIAEKGFSCTGIFPMNQYVSFDLDYLPSYMTEIPEIREDPSSMDVFRRLRGKRKKCPCNTAS
jgi:hypothetical protein